MNCIKLLCLFIAIVLIGSGNKGIAANITIIESSPNSMDTKWQTIASGMGHTATILPQTTLDNNSFFSTTDLLIVSSGTITLPSNRVNTILSFLQTGKPVYLQGEYQNTYTTNQAFGTLVNALGGKFTVGSTTSGTLAPMNILGSFATTNKPISSMTYFWYGCYGTSSDCYTEFFLEYQGKYYGFFFCPPNTAYGAIIQTTDQDWVWQNYGDNLMENIITHLLDKNLWNKASGMSSSFTSTASSCGQANGSATVSVTGGQSPYTYVWSNGQTIPTATNLASGIYSVTITDANACSYTDSVTIISSNTFTINLSTVNASCGNNNGSATVSVNGTSSPYIYSWSNGVTTSAITNLAAGNYAVIITDVNGCTVHDTAIINMVNAPTSSVSTQDASCNQSNGSASLSITGGSSPYSYNWSNGATTSSITNLAVGTYSVIITDINGCTTKDTAVINSSAGPIIVMSSTDASCGQSDGSASALVSGGASPYYYVWNNTQTTSSITNLPLGTYSVTVTDANGCTIKDSAFVNSLNGPTAIISTTDASCSKNDGSATVTASGDSFPFTYLWNTGDTTQTIIDVPAGNYSVTVTDALGCSTIATAIINGSLSLVTSDFTYQAQDYSSELGMQVSFYEASLNAIQYYWDFGDGYSSTMENPSHTYLDTGIYIITLYATDQNGCLDSIFKTLKVEGEFTIYIPNSFSPNGDGLNDYFAAVGVGIKDIEYSIFNRWGECIAYSTQLDYQWGRKEHMMSEMMEVYTYKIAVTDILNKKHRFQGSITLIK